ncbi:hypothetical protein [uncultured Psychroserpens sp.]|uniref:hypothetical protein n=1 Tax=uncultured Psychroserpens sp. TaxID=255436 RepID=UPI0026098272|nr:hypothetical protein [uncultured Psychroserpens sp.]
MKSTLLILALFITSLGISQSENLESNTGESKLEISDFGVSVTVDSVEEIESSFNIKDIEELLKETVDIQNISFEIICNGEPMSNGERSSISYKVNGNNNDINSFIKSVKKLRKAAINYYKNKP